jgi:hypothetical protein
MRVAEESANRYQQFSEEHFKLMRIVFDEIHIPLRLTKLKHGHPPFDTAQDRSLSDLSRQGIPVARQTRSSVRVASG